MKATHYSAEQIIRILEQAERSEQTVGAVCREHGIAEATFYRWRKTYGGMSVAEIYRIFPNLEERRTSPGTKLSGGEQQMLAIARILRTGAKLLLLDEISEGLAPVIVQKLAETIRLLKARGYTILMVEQNFRFAAPLADRFYVIEHGRVAMQLDQRELQERQEELARFLGV